MKNNIVQEKLISIQADYKNLLIKVRDSFDTTSSKAVLDEINVFWFRQRRFIDLLFDSYFKPYRTYLFSAAGYINVPDNEHFPFLALGDNHVLDDPIYKIMLIQGSIDDSQFSGGIRQHMFECICDNIAVLELWPKVIYILPCSLLFRNEFETIENGVQSSFLSMFIQDMSLKEYFQSIHTIDDIKSALHPEIERNLMFLEDDSSLNFIDRFYHYKNEVPCPQTWLSSDSKLFFFAMSGYFAQALDILYISAWYHVIPYIRFSVALYYVEMLSRNFTSIEEIMRIVFQSKISYILHNVFDYSLIENIDLQDYILRIKKYNFEKRLYDALSDYDIASRQLDANAIASITTKHLIAALSQIKS